MVKGTDTWLGIRGEGRQPVSTGLHHQEEGLGTPVSTQFNYTFQEIVTWNNKDVNQ